MLGIVSCSQAGCTDPIKARGMCMPHYRRWWRETHPDYQRNYRGAHLDDAREAGRKYRQANSEKERERSRRTYQADPERTRERTRRWRQANPGKEAEQKRKRYAADPSKERERGRKRRQDNPEQVRSEVRRSQRRYPEKVREAARRRRALKVDALVERYKDADICERDRWICQLCGKPVDPTLKSPYPLSKSIDHIIPLQPRPGEPKGTDEPSNVQLAHIVCNISKGNRTA